MFELIENGHDYHVLEQAAQDITNVPGITLEIGLRAGGGTLRILQVLAQHIHIPRTHVALDPYGQIPYNLTEHRRNIILDYTNQMKNQTIAELHRYCADHPHINFVFLPLEDTEFFTRFGSGIPLYTDQKKEICNQYALVHFDGPHTTEQTLIEAVFFSERASPGAIFVFDDVEGFYHHDVIQNWMLRQGWSIHIHTNWKIAYRKHS